MTSRVDAESLLAVDVGSVTTRAVLFDVVEGRYRFIASGSAPTTAGAPYHDISEGVRLALDQLQAITGRILIGSDQQLIMPAMPDGSGVDSFAATISAGEPVKVIAIGLLESISMESARRLALTTYSKVVEVFNLNDRRRTDTRLNAVVRLRPDLIVAAGGTENGASQSVVRLLEAVGLAGYLRPHNQRLEVLYVGNQAIHDELQNTFRDLVNLHFAPNVRPDLDVEQLDPAHVALARLAGEIRSRQMPGVAELNLWANGGLIPSATAFGRVIRFLGKELATSKGVLGVDVGASATTLALGKNGDLSLRVFTQFGLGRSLAEMLHHVQLRDIQRWLAIEVSEDQLTNYLYNKALYPASLPVTDEEMAIEQALARQILSGAASRFLAEEAAYGAIKDGLLQPFEAIVATGSVFTRAPNLAQATLMLLDGLQPTGVTTLVLDLNQIMPALGAAAAINPLLVVQVLESSSFLHLGTIIAPASRARMGLPVLRLKMTYESGHETHVEVKQGALEVLPLPVGQTARLHLQPLHRADVGMGAPGRGGGLKVMGGALGVIIDARGRPFVPPADRNRRQELFRKWQWTLGGQ
jgi:uncharacterized protein (TIGR01319 family)